MALLQESWPMDDLSFLVKGHSCQLELFVLFLLWLNLLSLSEHKIEDYYSAIFHYILFLIFHFLWFRIDRLHLFLSKIFLLDNAYKKK